MILEQLGILVEPFERVAFDTVGVWYLVTALIMTILSIAGHYVHEENETDWPDSWGLKEKLFTGVIVASIGEELLFRIAPIELGLPLYAIIAFSVVWAMMHSGSRFAVLISVPVFLKLALGGFYVEVILLHAFHNAWTVPLNHYVDE